MTGFSQYKSGIPKAFKPVVTLLEKKDPDTVRYLLTLLQVSRVIPAWKKVDLSTVTNPGPIVPDSLKQEFSTLVPKFLTAFGIDLDQRLEWTKLHVATTMGPSGHSMLQATNLLPIVLSKFRNLFSKLGGESLVEYMDTIPLSFVKIWEGLYPPKHVNVIRRLSTVPDVDGKMRVIAIPDYWSQSILKMYHKDIMLMLSRIQKIDMTFGQGIAPFGSSDHKYYSFDLSAATDRFPVEITEIMMSAMYGSEAGNA